MSKTRCVKCRKLTEDKNPRIVVSKGRAMRKSTCAVCGTKKNVFVPMSQAGGSVAAVAGAVNAVGDAVNTGFKAIDNQAERGFQKNQMTGKYDRKNDQNERRVMKRNYQFAARMARKYKMPLEHFLPK